MKESSLLDKTDIAMLSLLQHQGRITNQELADKIHLTSAPCLRRLKRLENDGIIERYVGIINRQAVALEVMALVSVALNSFSDLEITEFEKFIAENANITECYSVSGEYDFFLKIVASNIAEIENILLKQLLRLPIVRSATTNFVLGERKNTTALPLNIG
ncbi:MAG: Lrp/AsnC family transcriptional regulator [Pseudomonadales bacterium]|nr:Lrp/AsnC family transcriptional regulator [Pseudomonadales bacterium]